MSQRFSNNENKIRQNTYEIAYISSIVNANRKTEEDVKRHDQKRSSQMLGAEYLIQMTEIKNNKLKL